MHELHRYIKPSGIRESKAFEDSTKIVRPPAVSNGQSDDHRLWVSLDRQPLELAQELRRLVVNVELLEQYAQQASGPPDVTRIRGQVAERRLAETRAPTCV